ncbi:hypothetical protein AVEN_220209-1 [Araneus ventricosus]|uniref:Uncharacterized protein n=1 Tax=Araneus ventricosus TaxID=182803 RepID=A0A4Y2GZM9_ARAVE|nr:hypothetical protein AVEN_220209-1 [Araneus ventricosus]
MPKCESVSNFDFTQAKKEFKNAEGVMPYNTAFASILGAASEGNLNLDVHHRSNPFGGLLSRPVPFSSHKIWRVIPRSDCADRPTDNPYPRLLCFLFLISPC